MTLCALEEEKPAFYDDQRQADFYFTAGRFYDSANVAFFPSQNLGHDKE